MRGNLPLIVFFVVYPEMAASLFGELQKELSESQLVQRSSEAD